jgi:eukaryotic-like serine/threonine-protein kinase
MVGKVLAQYQVCEKLGEGGMGVVWKARDTHLDRFVALKTLPAERLADPERKRRSVQEAKAASALNHPNIVHIYDIAEADGVQFISMEYVPGKTLDQLIGRKGLRLNEVLKYAVQIADALAQAHAAGIIHRDLKPSNIIVSENGTAKVLDFGVAKLTEITTDEFAETATMKKPDAPSTEEGAIVGTVAYMSPEQAEGKKVHARSDIFSFGSMLYEMVTGRQAFHGDSKLSTLSAILKDDPKPVSSVAGDVPRDLEKIINRCLRKDPDRRYQHMDDLKVALGELKEESESGTAPMHGRPRRGWRARILFAVGAAVLAGAGLILWRASRPPHSPHMVAVPVTAYPGYERRPSFSPDGRQIAFSWTGESQDNEDIYVVLTSGGQPLRLTANPAADTAPAWSPDGQHIAFIRDPGPAGAVYLVSPLGGSEKRVTQTKGHTVCWTSDGSSIAIMNEAAGVSLISLASGDERKLTSPGRGESDDDCTFSDDGKYVAFVRWSAPTVGHIYIASANGTGPREITPESSWFRGLAWVPGSPELIAGPSSAIWDAELVRISVSRLATSPARPVEGMGRGQWPTLVRPPGSARVRLAYDTVSTDYNLYSVALPSRSSSRDSTRSSLVSFALSTRDEMDPDFSPDGSKVSFASGRSGQLEIWISDRDGSNLQQLTHGECIAGSPRWSPRGDTVAFDCSHEGNIDIHTIPVTGGASRRITSERSDDIGPSWSRDGHWIYFSSNRSGAYQTWKAPAEGGPALQVTRGGGYEAFESPDGKLLYYTSRIAPGLWSTPVKGGPETPVLKPVRYFWWAMADSGIFFARYEGSQNLRPPYSIEFYSFGTHKVAPAAVLERGLPQVTPSLAVTRDGRRLMVVQLDHPGADIEMIDDFR